MARLPFSNENVEEMFLKYVCCWTPFEEFKSKYWCRVHSKHCDGGCRWHFAFFKNANVFSQMLMSWHPSAKHLQIFCKHPKGLIMHILNAILQWSIVLPEQLLLASPAHPSERTRHVACSSRLQYFSSFFHFFSAIILVQRRNECGHIAWCLHFLYRANMSSDNNAKISCYVSAICNHSKMCTMYRRENIYSQSTKSDHVSLFAPLFPW